MLLRLLGEATSVPGCPIFPVMGNESYFCLAASSFQWNSCTPGFYVRCAAVRFFAAISPKATLWRMEPASKTERFGCSFSTK